MKKRTDGWMYVYGSCIIDQVSLGFYFFCQGVDELISGNGDLDEVRYYCIQHTVLTIYE